MNAMNTQTNAFSEPHLRVDAIAAPTINPTRLFYWSVRRELWENRSIYIAPLVAAGLAVVGILLGGLRGRGLLWSPRDDVHQQMLFIEQQWNLTGLLIMLSTFLVTVFYSLDTFYSERRDRSILFWKSLPVSDTVTVLSKASVPFLILPLVTFVIAAVTQWTVLAIDVAMLASLGRSVSAIGHPPLLQLQAGLLYHLVAVHVLWYAPIYAWLLLISAWAPRVPILWAFLPPLAIGIVEKIAFNTAHFARYIGYRISEGPSGAMVKPMNMAIHPIVGITSVKFLTSPGLWGGLLAATLFLAAAAQIRRYRAPN